MRLEQMIAGMFSEQHAPALKTPDHSRLEASLTVLHSNGITSAKKHDDKTISIDKDQMLQGQEILNRALHHMVIDAMPIVVSAESEEHNVPDQTATPHKPATEPTPPAGGERTLVNKKENQVKKIDEEVDTKALRSKHPLGSTRSITGLNPKHPDKKTKVWVVGHHDDSPNVTDSRSPGHVTVSKVNPHGSRRFDPGNRYDVHHSRLNEELELTELSSKTLVSYANKAQDQARDLFLKRNTNSTYYKRDKGIKTAVRKLGEEAVNKVLSIIEREQLDEVSVKTAGRYLTRASGAIKKHTKAAANAIDSGNAGKAMHHIKKAAAHEKGFRMAFNRMNAAHAHEETEVAGTQIDEGKKEDAEKSSKAFAKHPRANQMHQDMMHASKHYNYVTDACDHVYSNNCKHVDYADWDAMKPHIEDHFRKHGLED